MPVENLEEFSSWWRGSEGGQGWWPVWPPVQLLECTELANQPLSWACSTYSACTNLACAVCLLSTQAGHVPSLSLHLHLVYAVHTQSEKKLILGKNSACTNLAYTFSFFVVVNFWICEEYDIVQHCLMKYHIQNCSETNISFHVTYIASLLAIWVIQIAKLDCKICGQFWYQNYGLK